MKHRMILAGAVLVTVAACGGGGGYSSSSSGSPPTALSYMTPAQATVGTAMTALSPTVTGTVTSYSVSPSLPAGISINSTSGIISGTPTATAPQATYTITAANSNGSTTFALVLIVNSAAPSALSYASPVQATVGTAIAALTPTVMGTISSYSASPALPAGLSVDTTSGVISGTPRAVAAQSTYTITATNAAGSTTFGLVLTSLACDTGPPLALLPPEPSAAPGDDFTDPVTGHRIVRLSRLEGGGAGFYFHQNEFNCRGNKLVFANAHDPVGRWLYSIDLETFDIQPLASSEAPIFELTAPKRNEVLYLANDGSLRATNLDTHATRSIAQLPASVTGFSINSDETLIAGFYNDAIADYQSQYPTTWFQQYFDAHKLSYLFTVDADSGAFKQIHQENNWLDHVQFSPSDPQLLMFAHEGPADIVADRMWLIDATGTTAPRSLYREPVASDLVSHEFWSPDGRWVYFDHQVMAGYFIGGIEVATGTMVDYPIAQADWGLHYNLSHDGSMFASDGDYVSRKTLLLYRIVNGNLQVEPLADLSANYASNLAFAPNVHFTRDDKWVVYITVEGSFVQIYAVSVAK